MGSGPRIVALLPARNEAARLPRWFETAPAWCDAVVALDDGSTDATRALLEASPLVRRVLTSPVRPSAAGWHDLRNRQRLLDAAAALEPAWIVQVDADESLDGDDAAALRGFLDGDALPGLAYGLMHLRAWGDEVDPTPRWVYRVFAWRPGLRLPDEVLHAPPVPVDIPRAAWVRTTIRLRHFGATSEADLAARRAKYREADRTRRYHVDHAGLDAPPPRTVPWTARPAGWPVLASTDELEALVTEPRVNLAVLLPARNAAEDLPGWLENVRRFADAVVALDDGSTDGTREALTADPLVRTLLEHPRRATAAGWDDAANRQELLDAVAELAPRWVLFLDADERVDPEDAAALRAFLDSDEANRDVAYGFAVHRMLGPDTFDRAELWAYRLFAWRPGLLLPDERLHLVPVPVSIPSHRWRRTTVRIQHLAGATQERRRTRYEKYREADPLGEHQADYEGLLEDPDEPRPWEPRPGDLEVVIDPGRDDRADDDLDLAAPVLSAVVIARDDPDRIERVVRSVVSQQTEEPFEVIVVVSGSPRTAAIVRDRFPQVALVELDRPVLPGAARNAGLGLARGDYVSFPGSHTELPQGSLEARMRAHERGYPMVTGSTLNGTRTPAGWAGYFLDHSTTLPARPAGELLGPPAHCSYDRQILLRVDGFPEDLRAGEDTVVNHRLASLGYRAYRAPDATFVHVSRTRTPWQLARHHFERGRGLGRIVVASTPPDRRVLRREVLGRHLTGYLPRRIGGTRANVQAWGGDRLPEVYRRVAPLVWLGAVAAWVGCWVEICRPGAGMRTRLLGRGPAAT